MNTPRIPAILDLFIPYCIRPENYMRRICAIGSNAEKNAYMAALKREVLAYETDLRDQYEIQAVRLSGGSATVMSPDLLGNLLKTIREHLPVRRGVEISVDAHPLTIGTPALTGIGAGRPNRFELMMRSQEEDELRTLGCSFSEQNVRNAVLFFHKFHINNLSLTVNYGIPGQTENSWHNTLHACVIYQPAHISLQPVFAGDAEETPDENTLFAMYHHACDYLKENGYIQYSAWHFCLPHHGSLFELCRMDGVEKIGLGLGNRTNLDGYLTRNTNNLKLYIRNGGDFEKMTAQVFRVSEENRMDEYAALRLRSTDGLSSERFEQIFGTGLPESVRARLDERVEKGWLTQKEGLYVPTRRGLFETARLG